MMPSWLRHFRASKVGCKEDPFEEGDDEITSILKDNCFKAIYNTSSPFWVSATTSLWAASVMPSISATIRVPPVRVASPSFPTSTWKIWPGCTSPCYPPKPSARRCMVPTCSTRYSVQHRAGRSMLSFGNSGHIRAWPRFVTCLSTITTAMLCPSWPPCRDSVKFTSFCLPVRHLSVPQPWLPQVWWCVAQHQFPSKVWVPGIQHWVPAGFPQLHLAVQVGMAEIQWSHHDRSRQLFRCSQWHLSALGQKPLLMPGSDLQSVLQPTHEECVLGSSRSTSTCPRPNVWYLKDRMADHYKMAMAPEHISMDLLSSSRARVGIGAGGSPHVPLPAAPILRHCHCWPPPPSPHHPRRWGMAGSNANTIHTVPNPWVTAPSTGQRWLL